MSHRTPDDLTPAPLPPVLAGPILRRVLPRRLTLWLATRAPAAVRLDLDTGGGAPRRYELAPGGAGCTHLAAGERLHYLLVDLELEEALPAERWIGYRLALRLADEEAEGWQEAASWAPDLCYPGRATPGFRVPGRVDALLHGSCRKPHHPGGDGLVEADRWLAECLAGNGSEPAAGAWPAMLVLTGDQVYADDVAGPMLRAIHCLIARLGLPEEDMAGLGLDGVRDASGLYADPDGYYRREALLPRLRRHRALLDILFGGARKPIFTSDNAHNHLVSLAEALAMYLLVWSPAPWAGLEARMPAGLTAEEQGRYREEEDLIDAFVAGLPAVRRVLAHLPVAMIFDDHDITDDWNLSREWEETVYAHPFSRRIIGNALIAYLLGQAWGNGPEAFPPELMADLQAALAGPGTASHDRLIDALLRFAAWDCEWPTEPPLILLDTRTRRWRSESTAHRPSGLLDWEALTDLQRQLRDRPAVLMVSAAPIFGVKLIEAIQRVFTWLGFPLLVDAENWMAHPGTAHGILNVFRHPRTPQNFVVLSGDVHYSFVYDVELRGRRRGPDIWQICSSGLRNTFPERLLDVLDRMNRWLYSPRSPLNWLTRRRHMRVIPRKPEGTPHGRRLLNASGIGLVELDHEGRPWRIRQLVAGGEVVTFTRREEEGRWD